MPVAVELDVDVEKLGAAIWTSSPALTPLRIWSLVSPWTPTTTGTTEVLPFLTTVSVCPPPPRPSAPDGTLSASGTDWTMTLTDALIPGLTPASVWVIWKRALKVTTLDATVPTGSISISRAASSPLGTALTVTVASWPTFSLVASVSAKLPFSWSPWTPSIVTNAVELELVARARRAGRRRGVVLAAAARTDPAARPGRRSMLDPDDPEEPDEPDAPDELLAPPAAGGLLADACR